MEQAISVKNVTKKYGSHTAVSNISFEVGKGEIVGFLGPNGAGKTTTMNMITGYISATGGEIKINGHDILDEPEAAKRDIGYMPDNPPLYGDMLVIEYLNFVCDIKNVKKSARKEMLLRIMETVKIVDVRKRLIKNLSKGYRQRVGLAQALVGFPKALILDEPTVGLDPKQIIEMRDVIKKLGKNHTVILSSHILPEVSVVCDRLLIINRGEIVAGGKTAQLTKSFGTHGVTVRVKGERERVEQVLSSISLAEKVVYKGSKESGAADFTVTGKDAADVREPVFAALAKSGLPILLMRPDDMSLEDIFLAITNGSVPNMNFEGGEIS